MADIFSGKLLVERDHMIEKVPPATSYPTLGNSILPRTVEGRPDRPQADIADSRTNGLTAFSVPVVNQESPAVIKREGFAQLLRDPEAGWMLGDIAVQNAPAVMCYHEETVQDLECERWDSKEIHRRNRFTMIL